MTYEYQSVISKETHDRLTKNGLTLEIREETGEVSYPRYSTTTSFVGGDIEVPREVDKGECFNDFVKNYCHDILDCKPSDLVWAEVNKHEHHNVHYSLQAEGWSFSNSIAGFIFISKADLRKELGIKRITKEVEDATLLRFTSELERYSHYCNGEVYLMTIHNEDVSFDELVGELYNIDNEIDVAVNKLIDKAVARSAVA